MSEITVFVLLGMLGAIFLIGMGFLMRKNKGFHSDAPSC